MKYNFLDFISCIHCQSPLICFPFETVGRRNDKGFIHFCESWCVVHRQALGPSFPPSEECNLCHQQEIKEGLLVCSTCDSFYPVINFIPEILPDSLRDEERERNFLIWHQEKFAVNDFPFDPLALLERGFKKEEAEETISFKRPEQNLTR